MISSPPSNGPGQGRFGSDGFFNLVSQPHRIAAKLEACMGLDDRLGFALAQADTTPALASSKPSPPPPAP